MIDPVERDIERELDAIERSEAIEYRADSLWYHLDRHQMLALLERAMAEQDTDRPLFSALAHLLSCNVDTRQNAMFNLFEAAKEYVMPYLLEKAEDQLARGVDEWGDFDEP